VQALFLTVAWTVLWAVAMVREGSWDQERPTDAAVYHTTALVMKRAIAEGGLAEAADAWVNADCNHGPLVPMTSGIVMLAFGESRGVAESIIPFFVLLYAWAVIRCVRAWYSPAAAFFTAVVSLSFPVVLIFGRVYMFEFPSAALFLASLALLSASDRLGSWRHAIGFGVLAGLASLARMGAPAYYAGPVAVAIVAIWRSEGRWLRFLRLACGLAIAGVVMGTWYVPNLPAMLAYVRMAAYGGLAEQTAPGGSALSAAGLWYYSRAIVREGPGVPMAAVAILAFAAGWWTRERMPQFTRPMAATAAVFFIDFGILLFAAQNVGARYFIPLMPIVALWIVRAVASIQWRAIRLGFGAAIGALAAHHVVALTFTFAVPPPTSLDGFGDKYLWAHWSEFMAFAGALELEDTRADFKLDETIARIETMSIPDPVRIFVLSEHFFVHVNAYRYHAVKRRLPCLVNSAPSAGMLKDPAIAAEMYENISESDVLIAHSTRFEPEGAASFLKRLPELNRLTDRQFVLEGEPILLGDGSHISICRREWRSELTASRPAELLDAPAKFAAPGGDIFELLGYTARRVPGQHYCDFTVCFRIASMPKRFPRVVFRTPVEGDFVEASAVLPRPNLGNNIQPGQTLYWIVRERLNDPRARREDFTMEIGVRLEDPRLQGGIQGFGAESPLPTKQGGTFVVFNVPPPER
jgi:4-amino-4-deoxy-L-arabinose transferase-like glycosyltransferase